MSHSVGARDLKTRLGSYLRLVRAGRTFVVTDRGRPVAELRPVSRSGDDEAAILLDLAATGAVTLPTSDGLTPFKPMRIGGEPLSETIREGREDRF